jgi:hypothetical protein
MRRFRLAAIALTGLFTLTTLGAAAAPSGAPAGVHPTPANGMVTNIDYWHNHHHWHHRHWNHGHWHYWD